MSHACRCPGKMPNAREILPFYKLDSESERWMLTYRIDHMLDVGLPRGITAAGR